MSIACEACKLETYNYNNEKVPVLIFSYPSCDLVCRNCGVVQHSEANYKYSVDQHIKQQFQSNDGAGKQCNLRISSCEYDPACDVSAYRRSKTYDGYNLVFHANEVIARGSRPIIPEEAVDYLCEAGVWYYESSKKAEESKNLFGLGFSYSDAQRICDKAAELFEKRNAYRRIEKPRRGDRETVTAERLKSYAVRWVQIWKILLGPDCLDPKIHPFCPPVLEVEIRVYAACMTRCWFQFLKLPRVCSCRRGWCEHKQKRKEEYENCSCELYYCEHTLSSSNCRHALFLRAAMYMLGARTSLRRTVRLEGTKVDDWYKRLWYLWPKLRENYSSIWSGYHRDVVTVLWPKEPPPLSKLKKNEPSFKKNKQRVDEKTGVLLPYEYKPRWYEEDGNFVEDERSWYLEKKRKRSKLNSSW